MAIINFSLRHSRLTNSQPCSCHALIFLSLRNLFNFFFLRNHVKSYTSVCKQQTYLCCASKYIMSGQIALESRWRIQYRSVCALEFRGAQMTAHSVNVAVRPRSLHSAQHSFVWLNYKLVYHLDFSFSSTFHFRRLKERRCATYECVPLSGKLSHTKKIILNEEVNRKITTFVTITINLILRQVCAVPSLSSATNKMTLKIIYYRLRVSGRGCIASQYRFQKVSPINYTCFRFIFR